MSGSLDVTDKRVATFSRGMRQRLGLAEILMKDAQIAILDEPTSGLDPQATIELLEIIRELKQHGVSVLLSSHLLDRVQSVCDRVALFNLGNIALIGTVPELGREVLGGGFRVEVEAEGQGLAERLAAVPGVQRVETVGANRLRLLAERDVRPEAAAAVVAAGGRLLRLSVEEPSLEAIYTALLPAPTKESVMRREGSALHGFGVVILKEIADHFTSVLRGRAGGPGDGERDRSRQPRHQSDQGEHGRRSVPVPAAVHPQRAAAAGCACCRSWCR